MADEIPEEDVPEEDVPEDEEPQEYEENSTQAPAPVSVQQPPSTSPSPNGKAAAATGSYSAADITVLASLEAIRKRPGMYVGTTDVNGLHHIIYEVVDNSVDEALAGFCTEITVIIHKDNYVTVIDNGRGIPVQIHPKYNKSALEVVLTKLHSGSKFDRKTYKVSGGLHGVGISVVNALSKELEVTVHRDSEIHQQTYRRGRPVAPVKVIGKTDRTGTTVRFLPDDKIFDTMDYKTEVVADRLRELAFLTPGLLIYFTDERVGRGEQFHSKIGIVEFVTYLNKSLKPLHEVISFSTEKEDIQLELAMQYTTSYRERTFTFANNINTHEGGTHLIGFKAAITRTLNTYAKAKDLTELPMTSDDVREGLTSVLSVKLREPQFEGQTKTKLGNSEVKGLVESMVNRGLTSFLEENPQVSKLIIEKCVSAARAREAARKARELTRRKSVLESSPLPGKLADCSSREAAACEIFVVEGDSAGGCFSGDTKVALADGRDLSFRELVEEHHEGKEHYCYTLLPDGHSGIGKIEHPRCTRRDADVIRIILDNGKGIVCTPDHLFMLRDGSYRKAEDLSPRDSLMPLRKQLSKLGKHITIEGYELVYDVADIRWVFTHLLSDEYNLRQGIYPVAAGEHRHHRDFDKRNNDPTNVCRLSREEHLKLHSEHAYRTLHTEEAREKSREARRTPAFRRNMRDRMLAMKAELSERAKRQWEDEGYKNYMRERFLEFYHENDEYRKEMLSRLDEAQRAYWASTENRAKQAGRVKAFFKEHPEKREELSCLAKKQWASRELRRWRGKKTKGQWTPEFRAGRKDSYDKTYRDWTLSLMRLVYEETGRIEQEVYDRVRLNAGSRNVLRWDTCCERFFRGSESMMRQAVMNYNHKVERIERLAGRADVYDLEVAGTHNFALASGVFVHNSAKQARNREFQAILPLRGKILNVEKSRLVKVLKSTEIVALVTVIGTGIAEDFDVSKARYHKIVIMTDADVDGAHIRTLLLTFFFRYMGPLIEAGYIYMACPPLYKVSLGKGETYLYSDEELAKFTAKHKDAKFSVQRYKGLGEMNPKQLWDTTMDPAKRKLFRMTIEDAVYADQVFSLLMGDEVDPRREFIEQHALEVKNLDV